MRNRFFIYAFLLLGAHLAAAQQDGKLTVRPYGFVRSYLNIDSRKNYTVVGGEYNMLPLDQRWNEDGSEDLNAIPQVQLQAFTSRFGLTAGGLTLAGHDVTARLEADFGGFGTQSAILRLRLAYINFQKQEGAVLRQLLIGQDWHPMTGGVMPEVLGMAAGAPFRPHSRTPQVRASVNLEHWGATAALLYQNQYVSNGPLSAYDPTSTASRKYADQALFPEVFLGLHYRNSGLYLQLGCDYQMLHPRTTALIDNVTRRVDETVVSFSPTLYAKYETGLWSFKARFLLAQNTSHLNQPIGYAVTGITSDSTWTYHPLQAAVGYLNITYGSTWRANLFLGAMQNLGAQTDLYNFGTDSAPIYLIYAKGGENFTNLNGIFRIAPSISYNVSHFAVGIEYECTAATYGALKPDGSIAHDDQLRSVVNHRICTMVKYSF